MLLRFLIIVALMGFFIGSVKTLLDLQLFLKEETDTVLRHLLLNVIVLLAVIEVVKTSLNYLTYGRVRVTYIVDTVLIVMLNEVISIWYKGITFPLLGALLLIIFVLMVIRIFAIRFSPDREDSSL